MTRLFRPKASVRAMDASGRSLYFYELVMAPGPAVVGDTGDGSAGALFGTNWVTLINRDDLTLHAFKEGPIGTWTEETAGLPASFGTVLPSTVRRLSHAFDQAARIIVAWEDSGTITATRWDITSGAYVSDVIFAGVNPCLLMQATVDGVVGGSDIWLFYQRSDAPGEVFYRMQRDSYGVEYSLVTDTSIAVLDRVVALPYRFELWVSDQYGQPLQALVSEYYPIPASDIMPLGIKPEPADYAQMARMQAEEEPARVSLAIQPTQASTVNATRFVAPPGEPLALGLAPANADLVSMQIEQVESDSFGLGIIPGSAEYLTPGVRYAPSSEGLGFAIASEGAEYHATS